MEVLEKWRKEYIVRKESVLANRKETGKSKFPKLKYSA
jgi:hypothetical protein